jgi:hypothetical protein
MNIINAETPFMIEAKTCGCEKNKNVSYRFIESGHGLCYDKKEIILAQIQACDTILKHAIDETDFTAINN